MIWLKQYALYLKAGAAIATLALLTWAAVSAYSWAYNNGHRDAETACLADKLALSEAAVKDLQEARAKEQAIAKKLSDAGEQHEQDLDDAKATAARVAADLRADNLKLRQHWQGCQATGRVSGDAASAALADAQARLREKDAGEAIGDAKRADDWIKRLQDTVRAYQSP